MSQNHPSEPKNASPTELNLINSKRLQTLRQNSLASEAEPTNDNTSSDSLVSNAKEDARTKKLRRQIDQRLAEIVAQLPVGKQHSLFKIRFGVALDEIQNLPLEQIAQILKIVAIKR